MMTFGSFVHIESLWTLAGPGEVRPGNWKRAPPFRGFNGRLVQIASQIAGEDAGGLYWPAASPVIGIWKSGWVFTRPSSFISRMK